MAWNTNVHVIDTIRLYRGDNSKVTTHRVLKDQTGYTCTNTRTINGLGICKMGSNNPEGGILVNQEVMANKSNNRTKIIKRYQNRKLYDTQQSCYVTLDDIAKMIRASEEVMVIDNKTKNDITAATLTQIIFEAEKKASQYAPLFTLREIIQNGNGSISSFLAKLGAFPKDYAEKQQAAVVPEVLADKVEMTKPSVDDVKQTLEERVASAANQVAEETSSSSSSFENGLPDLPNNNNNLGQNN